LVGIRDSLLFRGAARLVLATIAPIASVPAVAPIAPIACEPAVACEPAIASVTDDDAPVSSIAAIAPIANDGTAAKLPGAALQGEQQVTLGRQASHIGLD